MKEKQLSMFDKAAEWTPAPEEVEAIVKVLESVLQDSGERREFETGAVRDMT